MQIWIFDFFCRDLIFLEITKEIYNNIDKKENWRELQNSD